MIEFQYFRECPNAQSTLENVRALLDESFIGESELVLVEVPTPELASRLNFQGSPSILVDGIDIFSETRPGGSHFACRIYELDGVSTGVLPKEFIRSQIRKIRGTSDQRR
jgi:hypothetical protein